MKLPPVAQSVLIPGAPTGFRMLYVLCFVQGEKCCRILEKELCLERTVLIFVNFASLSTGVQDTEKNILQHQLSTDLHGDIHYIVSLTHQTMGNPKFRCANLRTTCVGKKHRTVPDPNTQNLVACMLLAMLHVLYQLYLLMRDLTFRHRASYILGQAFHYSPENAFYIFNQQIYFII